MLHYVASVAAESAGGVIPRLAAMPCHFVAPLSSLPSAAAGSVFPANQNRKGLGVKSRYAGAPLEGMLNNAQKCICLKNINNTVTWEGLCAMSLRRDDCVPAAAASPVIV